MKSILILGAPTQKFVEDLKASHGTGDSPCEIRIVIGDEFADAREIFVSEIFQWTLRERPLVVTYTAGWQGGTQLMSELMSHLTGRSVESLQFYLFDLGVEVKSKSFSKGLLSIKDLMEALDQEKLTEQQRLRFQVLGELIR